MLTQSKGTTENPRHDMIDALDSVSTYIDTLISSLQRRKRRSADLDCTWLDEKLDDLIGIGNDTSQKSNITEMSSTITSADIDSCTAEELVNLKEDKELIDDIVCDLKQQIGEACTTDAPASTQATSTLLTTVLTSASTRITTMESTITSPKLSSSGNYTKEISLFDKKTYSMSIIF